MHKYITIIMLIFIFNITYAADFSLDLEDANLKDAIRFVATSANINVIISPSVNGSVTLSLKGATPTAALDSILVSQGLAKWQVGNLWYIATQDELIKRKQDEMKFNEFYDKADPLVIKTYKVRYAKASDIAHILQDQQSSLMSARGIIHVDARTNILLVEEVQHKIIAIQQLIQSLDVPVKQIMIEAKLASVDNDRERELGVDFSVNQADQPAHTTGVLNAVRDVGRYSIAIAKLPDGSRLDVKLAALEATGHAELISTPRLFTSNQQSAYIESGEEVPYQEVSESGGTAVTFKKAVLGLRVSPQILPGNKVLLQLKINQDRPGARMVQGVPAISTRQMVTSVLVKNGETVVLGGIYEDNKETGERRLPFLADIPVIGALFRTQTTRQTKRELLIFVTPKIIS